MIYSAVCGKQARKDAVQVRHVPDGAPLDDRFPDVSNRRTEENATYHLQSHPVRNWHMSLVASFSRCTGSSTLYSKLQDHDVVKNYPPVRGMAKDIFFLSHQHKENGGEDESISKYNTYEVIIRCARSLNHPGLLILFVLKVDIIADLVMYLLR